MPTINYSKYILVTALLDSFASGFSWSAGGLAKAKLETVQIDVDTDKEMLKKFVDDVINEYPDLDSVVLCAGVQHEVDFKKLEEIDLKKLNSEMNVNYTLIVSMITFFLPHLLKLGSPGRPCFIIPVTSDLAIVPGAWVSNYSATKAALHSFSISLRAQLQDTNVHTLEFLVESELHDSYGKTEKLSKLRMPLDDYIKEAMEGSQERRSSHLRWDGRYILQTLEERKVELVQAMLGHRKDW